MEAQEFQALARAARDGDPDARERFFEVALVLALRAARKRLHPGDRALMESQDVQQSVLVRLNKKLPGLSFEQERDLAGWLAEATRYVLMEKRKKARTKKADVGRNQPFPTAGLADHLAESICRVVARAEIYEQLDQLPGDTGTAVRLRVLEKRSWQEIADVLGLPGAEAARKRFGRAIPEVSRKLGPLLDDSASPR